MSNIQRVGSRNKINTPARRYTLSSLISESYNTLYECNKDSKVYKLVESHINNIRKNPEKLDELSRDLCTLKGIVALGESALIKDSDISDSQEFTADMKLGQKSLDKDRKTEQLDDPDVINEEEEIPEDEEDIEESDTSEEEDEEVIEEEEEETSEDEEDLSEEDEIPEEDEEVIEEEEEEEITKEELVELKKHLMEMRRARKVRESKKSVKESRSWISEKETMNVALKHFRESSVNKAFYNTFKKMSPRLSEDKPLSFRESIYLYKASNSAMTQLAIELERNPEFIYTFKECTSILSEDTKSLLECIRKHKAPGKSLVESIRTFANILLESEEETEDYEDYEDEENIVKEEEEVIPPEEEETEEVIEEEEEEVIEDEPSLDEVDIISPEEDSEEVIEEEDENPDDLVFEESEDNEEITDEEAEALRKKLEEIRGRK